MSMLIMGDKKNSNQDADLILSRTLLNGGEDSEPIDSQGADMMFKERMSEAARDIKNAISSGNDERFIAGLTSFFDAYTESKQIAEKQDDDDEFSFDMFGD